MSEISDGFVCEWLKSELGIFANMAIEKTAQQAGCEPKRRRTLFNSLFASSNRNSKHNEPEKDEKENSNRSKDKQKSGRVSVASAVAQLKNHRNDNTSSKNSVDDNDSYELDLNNRLACERSLRAKSCDIVRVRPASSSSTESTTNHSNSPVPLSLSPTAVSIGEWHTNENYIPNLAVDSSENISKTIAATEQQQPNNYSKKSTRDKEKRRHSWLFKRRTKYKSPIMEQLFETYQKQLGSCDSPVLPSTISASLSSTSKSSSGDVTISSDDSLALFWGAIRPGSSINESNILRTVSVAPKGVPIGATGSTASERDQRLSYWHRLANRSSMPSSVSSSELEDDCGSDALVITCSDDTSCSSVELIWSRPSARATNAASSRASSMSAIVTPYVRAQQLEDASAKIEVLQQRLRRQLEQKSVTTDSGKTATSNKPNDWISYSPLDVRNNCLQGAKSPPQINHIINPKEPHKRPASGSDQPAKSAADRHLASPQMNGQRSGSALSDSSSADVAASFGQIQRHKPVEELSNLKQVSILELAKPLRARQSSRVHRSFYQQRVISNKKHMKHEPKQAKTAMEPQNAPVNGSQWVANPLFGRVVRTRKLAQPAQQVAVAQKLPVQKKQDDETKAKSVDSDPDIVAKKAVEEEVLARMAAVEERNRADRAREEAELLAAGLNEEALACDLDEQEVDDIHLDENEDFSISMDADDSKREADEDEEEKKVGEKRRWSFRRHIVQTPLERAQQKNAQLRNHFVNLKSNITSFKSNLGSKLSDTSRRASIFADQLITSLKENTKEQLFGMVRDDEDHYGTLANSFATPAQLRASAMQSSGLTSGNRTNNKCDITNAGSNNINCNNNNTVNPSDLLDNNNYLVNIANPTSKAKQFSLIFKHQQQLNGQPIVTRQPLPINLSLTKLNNNSNTRPQSVNLTSQNRTMDEATAKSVKDNGEQATDLSQVNTSTSNRLDNCDNWSPTKVPLERSNIFRNTLTMGDLERSVPSVGREAGCQADNPRPISRLARRRRRRTRRSIRDGDDVLKAVRTESSKTTFGTILEAKSGNFVDEFDVSDDEDEEERKFIDFEFKRLLAYDPSCLSRRKLKVRNRTLRYWRRFRSRRMGWENSKQQRDSPETM